jgi:hypothetical protein
MPHGQWVAFEGYETIHDCNTPVTRATTSEGSQIQGPTKEGVGYNGLEFPEVEIGSAGPQGKQVTAGDLKKQDSHQDIVSSPGFPQKALKRIPPRTSDTQSIHELVTRAIDEHRVLTITYLSQGRKTTTREIEPMKFDDSYCYAYCRLRKDFRNFRFAGIMGAEIKDETFVSRPIPTGAFSFGSQTPYVLTNAESRSGWRVPVWVWWVIIIIVLWLISRGC